MPQRDPDVNLEDSEHYAAAITNDPKRVLKALGVGESMRKAG
jgi:hypothetical protein